MPVDFDRNGLQVLDRDECFALLATVPVARVGVSIGALPAVLPVNFVVDGENIVVRTAIGGKLDAALSGAVVALEADDFDPIGHWGWSVLVQGRARQLTAPDEIEHVLRLPLMPWANEHANNFIAIDAEIVSGRRIHALYRDEHHQDWSNLIPSASR